MPTINYSDNLVINLEVMLFGFLFLTLALMTTRIFAKYSSVAATVREILTQSWRLLRWCYYFLLHLFKCFIIIL